MIELKLLVDEVDYDSLAETLLPLVQDKLRDSGAMLGGMLSGSPEMAAAMARTALRAMSQEKKDELLVQLVTKNRDKLLQKGSALAEKNGIALEREGDGVMIGSDALIYRMLFNLAENAVKYNRPDGSVHISVAQEDKMLHIRVADTGSGIPEEFRRSIFQPFFRVDKSRSREYGGVGLGLSLVWEIAGLHGGSVRVEESSERGTVFAVELPAQ